MMMTHKQRFPSIKAVAAELRAEAAYASPAQLSDCEEYIEVRLQVYPNGAWAIRIGDPSYDLDHRGFWGNGSFPPPGKRFNSYELARDLIEQARELHAMGERS